MNQLGSVVRFKACMVMVILLSCVYVGSAASAPFDCGQTELQQWLTGKSPAQVASTQLQLDRIGYPSGGGDGLVGVNTLGALTKLCLNQHGQAGMERALAGYPNRVVTPEGIVSYSLSADDLAGLVAGAEAIKKITEDLTEKTFSSHVELRTEVAAAFGDEPVKYAVYMQQVLQRAVEVRLYKISAETIAELELTRSVPDKLLKQLSDLKDQDFVPLSVLKASLKIDDVAFEDILQGADETDDDSSAGKAKVLINKLLTTAEIQNTYRLQPPVLSPVAAETALAEPLVLDLVAGLEGQAFFDRGMFAQALDTSIQTTASQYAAAIKSKLTESSLTCLAQLEEAFAKEADADGILNVISRIREQQGEICGQQLDKTLNKTEEVLLGIGNAARSAIINAARQVNEFEETAAPIWNSADADSRNKGNKMIYGLYPSWEQPAGEEPQEINFNGLTNIGYWGLPFDVNGNFPDNMLGDGKFILEAGRFKTAVDLVIYSNNWQQWVDTAEAAGLKQDAVDRLSDKIVALLQTENRRRPMEFFINNKLRGVTLYFDDLVLNDKYTDFVYALLANLRSRTSKSGLRVKLNLLLSINDLKQGVFSPELIRKINADTDSNPNGLVDRYLVLMAGGEGENKQLANLLLGIEQGEEIIDFRRKLVPIVAASEQSRDAVVDYVDSYGGVGFASLPAKGLFSRAELQLPSRKKVSTPWLSAIGIPFGDYLESIYEFTDILCQYRGYIYLLWWLMVVIIAAYILLCIIFLWPRKALSRFWPVTISFLVFACALSWFLYRVWWSASRYQVGVFWAIIIGIVLYLPVVVHNKARERYYP